MPKDVKENLHSKHRQRVKNKFLKHGFENFTDHEILEFLLFYSIPRVDTNEQAHRLLQKFGSISRVLEAPVGELTTVDGIGLQSAILISSLKEFFKVYSTDCFSNMKTIDSYEEGGEYCTALFAGSVNEYVSIICLDAANRVIETATLFEGSCNSTSINIKQLISIVVKNRAASIIMAHNHPGGVCIPSTEDLNVTSIVKKALSLLDISLKEHYIISGKNYIGLNRVYTEN